jgi:hypothetical protein
VIRWEKRDENKKHQGIICERLTPDLDLGRLLYELYTGVLMFEYRVRIMFSRDGTVRNPSEFEIGYENP